MWANLDLVLRPWEPGRGQQGKGRSASLAEETKVLRRSSRPRTQPFLLATAEDRI